MSVKSGRWRIVAGVIFLLMIGGGLLAWRARHMEPLLRGIVIAQLSDEFQSEVELRALHVRIFPRIGVVGEGLVLRHHGRTDIPPLLQTEQFSFESGIAGLLRLPQHIELVRMEKMTITLPPRGEKGEEREWANAKPLRIPKIVLDRIECNDAEIVTTPTKPGKDPLDWRIHNLILRGVDPDKPFGFHGTLTNAQPVGEIATEGQFGPWDAEDPGNSAVAGDYIFKNADLGPFPGIAGTLSSTGKFSGFLRGLTVSGATETPDFSLDKIGNPIALHTDFDATVDGTNGDTLLHPVRARLGKTPIVAEGKIILVPKEGHFIDLAVNVSQGRIEDILNLAVRSEKPVLSGPVKLKAKLSVNPGKAAALQRLVLDGTFGVEDAKWSSPEVREKLESLSRKAQGKPEDEDVGSALSDLRGSFHLEKGLVVFRDLAFGVEGAQIDLAGTYDVPGGALDLKGHLRLKAKLSQTTTGAKSFFLKAFDPFFSKNGAGTELPITISGTREKPVFGVSVFHKEIKKEIKPEQNGDKKEQKR